MCLLIGDVIGQKYSGSIVVVFYLLNFGKIIANTKKLTVDFVRCCQLFLIWCRRWDLNPHDVAIARF